MFSFDTFGRSNEHYEDQKAIAANLKTASTVDALPSSSHHDNVLQYHFEVKPDFDEKLIGLEMKTSALGIFKHDFSKVVLFGVAFHEDVENNLINGNERDKMLEKSKLVRGRTMSEDRVDADEDEKRSQMKRRREQSFDLKDYHSFTVLNTGVRNNADSLVYLEKMSVQNALSKVGNNYVIDLGKVMLEQLIIEEKNLKSRETDILMDFAKTYRYTYRFPTPAGYELEGAEALHASAENAFGKIAIASSNKDGHLLISIEKQYKVSSASAADWPQFLEFLIPAMRINDKKLVYKKVS